MRRPAPEPQRGSRVLTASAAMSFATSALVSDIGTLRERVLKHGGGWLLPVADAERWLAKLRALSDDLQGYAFALQEIRAMTFPDIASMADQYNVIYARLLANRPRHRRNYPASEPCAKPHAVGLREKPRAAPKGVERGGPLSQAEVERYQERRAREQFQRRLEKVRGHGAKIAEKINFRRAASARH